MARLLIVIVASVCLYFLTKFLFGDWNSSSGDYENDKLCATSIWIGIAFFFLSISYGSTIPGSIFERDTYNGTFYVYLYPGDQRTKCFHVPAEISHNGSSYFIKRAIIPNRRVVTFFDETVELGKTCLITDEHKRTWGVELTDRPVRR